MYFLSITNQSTGRERWWRSPLTPYRRVTPAATSDYIRQRPEGEWEPTYDFILEPREAMCFPTSWPHETRNVPPTTKDGDGRSAAVGRQAGRAAVRTDVKAVARAMAMGVRFRFPCSGGIRALSNSFGILRLITETVYHKSSDPSILVSESAFA